MITARYSGPIWGTSCVFKFRPYSIRQQLLWMGRGGGGQVVNVLAFHSGDLSSNPAKVYTSKIVFENNNSKQKQLFLILTTDVWLANWSLLAVTSIKTTRVKTVWNQEITIKHHSHKTLTCFELLLIYLFKWVLFPSLQRMAADPSSDAADGWSGIRFFI